MRTLKEAIKEFEPQRLGIPYDGMDIFLWLKELQDVREKINKSRIDAKKEEIDFDDADIDRLDLVLENRVVTAVFGILIDSGYGYFTPAREIKLHHIDIPEDAMLFLEETPLDSAPLFKVCVKDVDGNIKVLGKAYIDLFDVKEMRDLFYNFKNYMNVEEYGDEAHL